MTDEPLDIDAIAVTRKEDTSYKVDVDDGGDMDPHAAVGMLVEALARKFFDLVKDDIRNFIVEIIDDGEDE